MLYWDTSASLKLYAKEDDSAAFEKLLAEWTGQFATSVIAAAEFVCALHRKEAGGGLAAGEAERLFQRFEADCRLGRAHLIRYDDEVVLITRDVVAAAFTGPRPLMIRALDAIHVASAVSIGAEAIVTTDSRMREMAVAHGLKILP